MPLDILEPNEPFRPLFNNLIDQNLTAEFLDQPERARDHPNLHHQDHLSHQGDQVRVLKSKPSLQGLKIFFRIAMLVLTG